MQVFPSETYEEFLDTIKAIDELGLDVEKTAEHLSGFKALAGRGAKHLLSLANGGKYTLIDDSYSGQPEAIKLAIANLNKMSCSGRKIAVLGTVYIGLKMLDSYTDGKGFCFHEHALFLEHRKGIPCGMTGGNYNVFRRNFDSFGGNGNNFC